MATLPVLRPLVGFDKDEITAEAQRLGTYETSIIPDEDCCTLFTPRFPATRASREAWTRGAALDLAALVADAVEATAVEDFRSDADDDAGRVSRKTVPTSGSTCAKLSRRRYCTRRPVVKLTPGKLAGMKAVADGAA